MSATSPIYPDTLADLQEWCREYERGTVYPVGGAHIRFGVGIYQLHQAMGWMGEFSKTGVDTRAQNESLASAATHFITAAEDWDAPIELYVDKDVLSNPARVQIDWVKILYNISAAQQMFFYGYVMTQNNSERAARRFNREKMAKCVGEVVEMLFLGMPQVDRRNAIEEATRIMSGRI